MGWIKSPKKRRSWHALRTWTRVPGRALTRCGRTVNAPVYLDTLPGDERSCESCLRYLEVDRRKAA